MTAFFITYYITYFWWLKTMFFFTLNTLSETRLYTP